MQYPDLHEAYCEQLLHVFKSHEYVNSPRGNKSYEVLGTNFSIKDPRQRVCFLPTRKTNIVFNFAEALWYLSGSNNLDFIAYYAPGIAKYSADSKTLTGTAYGKKIFTFGPNAIDQWSRVTTILSQDDPDSKRAYIQIFDPAEDLTLKNIDVSCTLGLQFILRENQLHLIGYMRANDVYRGFLSDIFSFTFLQELMANQLGCELGCYYHQVGSLHLYDSDYPKLNPLLVEADDQRLVKYDFPRMPAGNNFPYIKKVLHYEKEIRENGLFLSISELQCLPMPDYWKHVIQILNIYGQIKRQEEIDAKGFEILPSVYQALFHNKWSYVFEEYI